MDQGLQRAPHVTAVARDIAAQPSPGRLNKPGLGRTMFPDLIACCPPRLLNLSSNSPPSPRNPPGVSQSGGSGIRRLRTFCDIRTPLVTPCPPGRKPHGLTVQAARLCGISYRRCGGLTTTCAFERTGTSGGTAPRNGHRPPPSSRPDPAWSQRKNIAFAAAPAAAVFSPRMRQRRSRIAVSASAGGSASEDLLAVPRTRISNSLNWV